MATIFGIILVGAPIVFVIANRENIANFIKTFINWHFNKH